MSTPSSPYLSHIIKKKSATLRESDREVGLFTTTPHDDKIKEGKLNKQIGIHNNENNAH